MGRNRRSRKRKRVDAITDLISELPRDVIDAVLERLPLNDAAKLSVLSRKWLGIWKSIQTLTLDSHLLKAVLQVRSGYGYSNPDRFFNSVSKILFYHEGNLLRFHLYIPGFSPPPDINPWIYYLSRKSVSEITIQYVSKVPLKLSSHIFSCCNLEKLKLPYLVINPPHNFGGFSKMTCLELDKPTFTERSLKRLIKSCPLLTKLSLTNFTGMEHIVINAPNLKSLSIDGTFKSLDVSNAANLVSAVFCLQEWVELNRQARLHALLETLASSPNLQKLCFGGYFCKALCEGSLLQTPFAKLQDLELSRIHLGDVDDFSSIMSTLQSFPAIRKLCITVSKSKYDVSLKMLQYNPDFVLANLSYAEVNICSGPPVELKLIEFLLKCAPILDKLSVVSTSDNIFKVFRETGMNKLLNFRRASQKVELQVHHSHDSDSDYDYDSSDEEENGF